MRDLVEKEKAEQNELHFYSPAPRNLSGASARGSLTHVAKVPDMILIDKVSQKSVGDTSNGDDEEVTKKTSKSVGDTSIGEDLEITKETSV